MAESESGAPCPRRDAAAGGEPPYANVIPHRRAGAAWSRRARRSILAILVAVPACRTVTPPPEAARTPELALEEVSPEAFPAFGDDLDYGGLEEAIERSLGYYARIAAADPGRTLAFGKERVPLAKVQATLVRFREIALARPSPATLGDALRREFRVFRSVGDGTGTVLFTGYYLPELRGSMARDGRYLTPLHRAPDDLVLVRMKDFPQLSADVIGRVETGRLVPYPTRAEIGRGALSEKAALCYVDSALDAFFLEIQGSGIVRFQDGTSRVVTYAGKNGHRYSAVGAELVRRGALRREELSMQAIKAWLLANPAEREAVLATNPSYVFFRFADAPQGSLSVPVTPDRTIAADARVFPKGALAFIQTERPVDATGTAFRPFGRFVLDQDAGGAIKTSARVDVYFGSGAYAQNAAGRMRHPGQLHYLLLR